ncbi:MAG TPA: hypothetical protein VE445_09840 [Nitrososphaeraceae archaeon]|jgi:hypothetical protein|nr:hypothetical protein [Nitrososphaeraceae archaeon]
MNNLQQLLLLEIDKEIKNFEFFWEQGQTAFKDGRNSAKKIFTLLKMQYGSAFPTKHIVEKMMNKLRHLNGISDYKIRNLLRDDFLIE